MKKTSLFLILAIMITIIFLAISSKQVSSQSTFTHTMFVSGIVCQTPPPDNGKKCETVKCPQPNILQRRSSNNVSVPFLPRVENNKICAVYVFMGQCGTRANGSIAIDYICQ